MWDYFENVNTSRGHLNRSMSFEATTTMPNWGALHPCNKPSNSSAGRCGCTDGGIVSASPDENDPSIWHVTIANYRIDTKNYTFPQHRYDAATTSSAYPANVGYIAVSTFMPFARFPKQVDNTKNYRVSMNVQNLRVTGQSGTTVTAEMTSNDNTKTNNVTLYAPGSISKYTQFSRNSYWSAGDAWASVGGTTAMFHALSYSGSSPILDLDQLMKFDDKAFDITSVKAYGIANAASQGTTTIWYAAKPDGTGWSSDTEMSDARVEHLVYYTGLDELKAAGKTCVGILRELRDAECYAVRDNFDVTINATIKPYATSGYVAQATSDVRAWTRDCKQRAGSVRDYPREDGSYGIGDMSWPQKTYPKTYGKPYADIFYRYKKTQYANGAIVGGHTGGATYGDSCLLVGARCRVDVSVADKDASDKPKSVYDLDANERIATWNITPSIDRSSANTSSGNVGPQPTSQATVQITLPKDLTYIDGTASYPLQSVEKKPDGTTVLTVFYEKATAGTTLTPITIQTEIGAAGTAHDVVNNQQLSITATITSPLDARKITTANGNESIANITVVRLAAISVFKSVSPMHANPNTKQLWSLRFSNNSETPVTSCGLVDTMPYPNDKRGSAFHGSYVVDSITVHFKDAPQLYQTYRDALDQFIWYTGDETARQIGDDTLLTQPDTRPYTTYLTTYTVSGTDVTYQISRDLADFVSWGIDIGTMIGHEAITIDIHVSPYNAISGDVYANSFTENAVGQASIVHSNVAKTDVRMAQFSVQKVWRSVNGLVGTPDIAVAVNGDDGTTRTVVCNKANNFTVRLELPYYDDTYNPITYTIEEPDIPDGYRLVGIEGSDDTGFTITNEALTGHIWLNKQAQSSDFIS